MLRLLKTAGFCILFQVATCSLTLSCIGRPLDTASKNMVSSTRTGTFRLRLIRECQIRIVVHFEILNLKIYLNLAYLLPIFPIEFVSFK